MLVDAPKLDVCRRILLIPSAWRRSPTGYSLAENRLFVKVLCGTKEGWPSSSGGSGSFAS
jgi:hypothetical protein